MAFHTFNLDPRVIAGIPTHFTKPTPIQEQSIPVVLKGHDLMGLAQTGTGKTAAFVLPILHRLMAQKNSKPRALIIAPTRELVEQICDGVRTLGEKTGLRCTTVYGGVSFHLQGSRLRHGVDIVIACPGRLLDHIEQRTIDLRELEVLVLDEADRMFDMGFLPVIRRIIKALPASRQTLLFSATMPQDIRRLANEILRNPMTVQIRHNAPLKTISHAIYPVRQEQKSDLLFALLKNTDANSVLVFTRTKHRARRIGHALLDAGYRAASLQGNLSQNRRQAALDGFRNGKYQILVATDIAARGIDVESVSHVINFDMPDTVEAYTHRIGRTGRAERSGDAFTFVTNEDRSMVRAIEYALGAELERRYLDNIPRLPKMPEPARNRALTSARPHSRHRRHREYSARHAEFNQLPA